MTKVVEGLLTIVKGLRRTERRQLVDGLVSSGVLREDDEDLVTIESRRGGSTRPLDQFIKEMKSRGRLR